MIPKPLASLIRAITPRFFDEMFATLNRHKPRTDDPYGYHVDTLEQVVRMTWPFYKHYFRARVFGEHHVQDRPYLVVLNHSGQVVVDAFLVMTAFITEITPPHHVRVIMQENLPNDMPVLGDVWRGAGATLGREDGPNGWQPIVDLLQGGDSVLFFAEGAPGCGKSTPDYYNLTDFQKIFVELGLQAGPDVQVLPVAVVGCEEFYPLVRQSPRLAKLLNLPYAPLTPNLLPLPSPVDIHIGAPFHLSTHLSASSPQADIETETKRIQALIQSMIDEGLRTRRPFFANRIVELFKR